MRKKFFFYTSGDSFHTFFVSKDKLKVFGPCWSGRIGLGGKTTINHSFSPTNVPFSLPIKSVVTGYSHSLLLTTTLQCFGCGSNNYFQISLTNDNRKHDRYVSFTEIKVLSKLGYKIVDIFCGSSTSFFISSGGVILSSGRNDSGQCGIGNKEFMKKPVPRIVKMNKNEVIVSIKGGTDNSYFLSKSGVLYMAGNTNKYSYLVPTKLFCEEKISNFDCGITHAIAVGANSGSVYGFGSVFGNMFGDLSEEERFEKNMERQFLKLKCYNGIFAVDAKVNSIFSLVLTRNKEVYGVGDAFNSLSSQFVEKPVLLKNNMEVVYRRNTSSEKAVLLKTNMEAIFTGRNQVFMMNERFCYAFGSNRQGQIGMGKKNNVPVSCFGKLVLNENIKDVKWELRKVKNSLGVIMFYKIGSMDYVDTKFVAH